MKKLLIILLVLAILAGTGWYFREPIIDLLPIDQSGWVWVPTPMRFKGPPHLGHRWGTGWE